MNQPEPIAAYKAILPRRVLKMLAVFLVVSAIAGSFLPGEIKLWLGTQPYDPNTGYIRAAHRLFHILTFGSIGFVLMMLARNLWEESRAGLLAFGLGASIEVVQHLIGFALVLEWWDVRDDFYAVSIAFFLTEALNLLTRPVSS